MKRLSVLLSLAAALYVASAANFAHAQIQNDYPTLDRKACADRGRLALTDTYGLASKETDGANPSETLDRTDGVICPPPELDPNIHAPAPGGGRLQVIPPGTLTPGTRAK